MSPTKIPASPDDVTAGWLTEALQTSFPGVEVTGTEVLRRDSGTTGRMRLGLTCASGAAGPESVFVKLPPDSESQQQLVAATGMGVREARFYAGPAAELEVRIPQPYFAAAGESNTEYVMVLEDLVASGCEFTTRLDPVSEEHGAQLMEYLSRVHATFWDDARFDGELSWVPEAMRGPFGAQLIGNAREQFADDFPPVFHALCELYIDHWEAICDLWDEGERTLIHGDTHAGNHFVDDGRVALYDWAVISRSPGIRDVAIYLGNSCPTEVRRAEQDAYLQRYHDALVQAGVDAPSVETLWTRYRRTVLYGWVAATTTASMGSTWQPIEVGMTGMQRSTDACADLETVEAIRNAL